MFHQRLQSLGVGIFLVRHHAIGREVRLLLRLGGFIDNAAGNADHRRPCRHFLHHHRVGADVGAVADDEAAEDFRARAHHHALAERRMALGPAIQRGAAERYALVDGAVIADRGGLADHHPHAVVDEHAPADDRRRVDFDAGQPAREVRGKAPEPDQPMDPEPMREAMRPDGVQARIAGQHFPSRARGRVALEYAGDVFT